MSLYAYQVMEKVIENGSFAKAAEVLNLTPSAVSHIITKLEDEVELQLLNRDRSGTTLTGNGEMLWPYIKDLLRMDENLDQKIAQIHGLDKGVVRLGTFNSITVQWLPHLLRSFRELYPNIELQIIQGNYYDMSEWMGNGTIDMAFFSTTSSPKIEIKNADLTPIYRDQLVCVAPPDFTPENPDYVTVDDIRDLPLIMQRSDFDNESKNFFDKHGLKYKSRFSISEDDGIMAMVAAGFGFYIMTDLIVRGKTGDFKVYPIYPEEYRELCIAVKKMDNPVPAVAAMRDHIIQFAKEFE